MVKIHLSIQLGDQLLPGPVSTVSLRWPDGL